MPQTRVHRRPERQRAPQAAQLTPRLRPTLVPSWAGWDAAVDTMIDESGPAGTRVFGKSQADNYRLILQGERTRSWREENGIEVPEDVSAAFFERFKGDLLRDADMRPASVQQFVKNLKTFLRWCKRSGFAIDEAALEVPNVDLGDEEPPDPFTEDEIARLTATAATPSRKFFVRFAWRTGLRVAEIERANVDDFDRDVHGAILKVPYAASKPSRRWRSVPLDTKTTRFSLQFRHYILHERGQPYADPEDPDGSADAARALFLNKDGKRWRAAGIQTYVRRLGRQAGIDDAHVHRFRHTFGTWCGGTAIQRRRVPVVSAGCRPSFGSVNATHHGRGETAGLTSRRFSTKTRDVMAATDTYLVLGAPLVASAPQAPCLRGGADGGRRC